LRDFGKRGVKASGFSRIICDKKEEKGTQKGGGADLLAGGNSRKAKGVGEGERWSFTAASVWGWVFFPGGN